MSLSRRDKNLHRLTAKMVNSPMNQTLVNPLPYIYFEFLIPASIAERHKVNPQKVAFVIMVGYEDEYAEEFEGMGTSGTE